jgi:hypothetical protein
VERLEQDLFRITWWRESGEKVCELARAASLTRRIDVLTIPESGPARLFAAEPYEQTQTANELAATEGR